MGVLVRYHRRSWWVFVNHRRRRKSKRCGDKATALSVARRIRERIALGDLSLLGGDTESFKTYAARWLTDGEGSRKATTHRFYAFNLELHIYPTLGAVPVGSINRGHCRSAIAAGRAKKLKESSLLGVQRTLSAVLTQAVEDGLLAANPAFRMGRYIRRGDAPRRFLEPLTPAEAHHFLTVVEKHWPAYHVLFLMALRTGLRLGELLGVQWGDLDLAGRFMTVQRAVVSGRVTSPKNYNRRRVDLSAKLVEALERRQTAAKVAALKAGKPLTADAWIFPNAEGGPLDGDNLRRRVFEKALTKAKLRHVRIHDLRHSCATHLVQNGVSLAYVRQQLGHSSITLTVDRYSHWIPDSNRDAVDALDATPSRIPGASSGKKLKSKNGRK